LNNAFNAKAKLIQGANGIFDVIVDGKRVFSRAETRRFPEPGEIAGKLKPKEK
jgi:predicted Rdx family selenoprotein